MDAKIHLTRKKDLFDRSANKGITMQEWSTFVDNDPEMRMDNTTTVTLNNGTSYTYKSPGTAVWLNRPPGETKYRLIKFDYVDGTIQVDNPDKRAIEKARHIAFKLNTRLFKETKKWTEELLVEQPVIEPRFQFGTLLSPLKKWLPQIRYFFQHFAFATPRNNEKLKDQ